MPTQKRIDGDYVITTINPPDDVIVNTNTMVINGNLDVVGNLTYIETTELKVDDPFITVAANNTGTLGTATFQEQGLVTQTSANTFAGLRFNNSTQTWQISPSVDANGAPLSAYVTLDTGGTGTPGPRSSSIQLNASGTFAGNAALTFDVANSAVVLQGTQVFGNIGSAPGAVANSVSVFHNAVSEGDTGLYVTSAAGTEELISKQRAVFYSLIF